MLGVGDRMEDRGEPPSLFLLFPLACCPLVDLAPWGITVTASVRLKDASRCPHTAVPINPPPLSPNKPITTLEGTWVNREVSGMTDNLPGDEPESGGCNSWAISLFSYYQVP